MQLYENVSEKEAAERLAVFFNNISNEYAPLDLDHVPLSYDSQLPVITPKEIEKEIKTGKRPKSRVDGDLFINVLHSCIDVLSDPICKIFNSITVSSKWPDSWKIEYVTIIPKCSSPESEADCRNISCTNFLSKVYERFVLKWCQDHVMPKNNQFGGQKGCSTNHFLAETFNQITDHLEDSRTASILTSIDYSKAFNRVEHLPLLQAFAKKGLPNCLIKLLATFLSGRKVLVKLGNSRSECKPVNAGAPQGSVLGTYVFNVATDALEDGLPDEPAKEHEIQEGDLSFLETQATNPNAFSTPSRNTSLPPLNESPITHQQSDNFYILPTTKNVPQTLKTRIEPTWRNKDVGVRKFVDDNLALEKLDMQSKQSFSEGQKIFKNPAL